MSSVLVSSSCVEGVQLSLPSLKAGRVHFLCNWPDFLHRMQTHALVKALKGFDAVLADQLKDLVQFHSKSLNSLATGKQELTKAFKRQIKQLNVEEEALAVQAIQTLSQLVMRLPLHLL